MNDSLNKLSDDVYVQFVIQSYPIRVEAMNESRNM